MPTQRKADIIADLTDKVGRSKMAVMLTYSGLSVKDMSNVRNQLRKQNVELKVTKNTLLREATRRANWQGLDHLFVQSNAVAFVYDDEPAASKAINDVVRASRGVVNIRSGVIGGRELSPENVARIADLPSRDALLAQALGAAVAPLQMLLATLNAPVQQLAWALAALQEQKGAGNADAATA